MNRKELQAELKEIREDFNIEINLRASAEKLQGLYDYWVTSGRIEIKRRLKTLAKMRTRAIKNPERLAQIDAEWVQLWERYDAIDTEVNEVETIETNVKAEPIEVETPISNITPSANLNTLEISTSENLETLEFPQSEILETLENPQGSAHGLDRFEVTYQVLDSDDEVSYESRKVYARNYDHAKSIVSQDLSLQHLRFCITGVEYALVIDDLSNFAMTGYGEF